MKKQALAFTLGMAMAGIAAPAFADFSLKILHINDVHSRIQPINKYDSNCGAEDNAAGECFGGMARVATAIETRRSALEGQGFNVLTLDAGDQFQGSLFYTTYKGALAAQLMNMIGFDAMAVGNHEFDDGPEKLAEFVDAVDFPVLFANANLADEPLLKGKVPSHIVKEIDGEKVAIIGVLAEDTAETSSPGDNVKFIQAEEVLKKLVTQLEADGVNKIVLLSHVGINRDIAIAQAVDGIDVIVGGHSHTLLDEYPTMAKNPSGQDVPIVQAYAYSKYLGELSVTWDDEGNVTEAEGAPWLLDARVPEDKEMLAVIEEKAAPLEAIKAQVVGASTDEIVGDRNVCRAEVCSMGVLVTEAMLDRTKDQGVQIVIQNGGGLRASIDAGEITMGEVLTVLPFQNTLATFELKGEHVIEALENGVSQVEDGAGRFPQVAGMKYTWDPEAEPGSRIVSVEVMQDDGSYAPLDESATYMVATNNYMRAGGDGYKVFETEGMNAYDYGPGLEVVVADYIAKLGGEYTPMTDDRISKAE
ncbi:bifunctional metallophosphatase/5'-nucleotidase [Maritalea mediterranea]|uniref:5'-nucleotidase/apyrase family protein n=1 Tax=Maritalea mediterranea TaxID=2909667 RepID=A0ABS9EBL3_9HYPH|nr:bifunctional metallophosphatase/5'-nucleotidase [Maritalea mediterranea]MCF4099577.1 5'-nucleotidase/apyrase family protein [Maritalea mediterranea]